MIRTRRTRMVCTLGPASRAPDRIVALARAGADVFRLNFSHGTHDDHAETYASVRAAEETVGRPLGILGDLQGPKFRLGDFKDGSVHLTAGQAFRLDLDTATPGDAARVGVPHPEILAALVPGATVLIDDGKVRLKVETTDGKSAETTVIAGDELSNHKGLGVPGLRIPLPALTEKDRQDLAFALRLGVDWIALSFVQHAQDMAELRKLVQGRAAVMAKIEKPSALDHLDEILDLCDGLMIARGDLGVEMAPEEVPVVQRTLIHETRARGIPVIVATQMLDSMTRSPAPTRAEVSDVANAVYEGADALMLSGETAAGDYPVESAAMMDRIMSRVEQDPRWPKLMAAERDAIDDADTDALVAAARRAADATSTNCLVAFTATGTTARRLSRERPLQPVLALTPNPQTAHRLTLVWGLEPRVATDPNSLDEMTDEAVEIAASLGLAKPGGRILIIAGTPFGAPGSANLLRFAHAPYRS
ncbi:MAG: pyruvate kinase [Caulobacteraceae bacterium]